MDRSWMVLVVLQLCSCVLADPARDSYSPEDSPAKDLLPPRALDDSTDLQPPAASAPASSEFPVDMDENTRRRRGLEPLGPLNRRKRTYHYNPCNTCGGGRGGGGYKPHRVEVVLVPHQSGGGCGNNCGGGYRPQPRPQLQQNSGYCDPCNRPGGGGGGYGGSSGSSSSSSAQASAQSYSSAWGKKK